MNCERLARNLWTKGCKDPQIYFSLLTANLRYDDTIKALKDVIKSGDTILDAGCNSGALTNLLRFTFNKVKVKGIDIVSPVEENFCIDGVSFRRQDIFEEKGKYDVVVCAQVLEHLDNDKEAYKKLYDAAKRTLVISVPSENYKNYPTHKRNYTKEAIMELVGDCIFHDIRNNYYLITVNKEE